MSNAKKLDQVVEVSWSDTDPPEALLTQRKASKYQILYDAIDSMELNKWRRFELPGDVLNKAYNCLASYVSRKKGVRYNLRTDKSKLPEVGIIYLRLLGPK